MHDQFRLQRDSNSHCRIEGVTADHLTLTTAQLFFLLLLTIISKPYTIRIWSKGAAPRPVSMVGFCGAIAANIIEKFMVDPLYLQNGCKTDQNIVWSKPFF